MRANGFVIVSPEQLSLPEQIATIRLASEVACLSGTLPHTMMFARDGAKLTVKSGVKVEQGGISSDTGAATSDDRQTTLEFHLNGVLYQNLYVTAPADGWDSLLVSAQ